MENEKEKLYATQFAEMLKIPTVTDSDKKLFDQLHDVMWNIAPEFAKLERANPRNSCLVIKWPGKKHDRPLVLMGHQDVVPEEEAAKWKYPPYGGVIAEGKIWGRGAIDCKSTVFASMVAANELIKEGFVPEQDIYFAYGDDEENSGGSAKAEAKYLTEQGVKPALVIDEGGGMVSKNAFAKYLRCNVGVLGVQEKGFADIKFIARSNGGHSSAPTKNTPFVRLAKFILDIENHNLFDVKVMPVVKETLADISTAVKQPALRPLIKNAKSLLPLVVKLLPDTLTSELKAMLQTTMVFTMSEGSHAPNNIPDAAWVLANLRYSPQEGHEKSIAKIKKYADKYNLEIEVLNTRDASDMADTKSAEYKFTVDMINKTYGETVMAPYLIVGGTDCRYMQDICKNALRFTPFMVSLEEMHTCHGYNERIGTDTLVGGVNFFTNVIKEYK